MSEETLHTFNPWVLYREMLRSRVFEETVSLLWKRGLISGEMHTGMGEEAIVAGVVKQLEEGDAMALDHRGTAAMLMRGTDPLLLLKEFLGMPDGLCSGYGGHMHLFDRERLTASSGIVGSSGPAAAGFGLAARLLRPRKLAVAFFGEGAMNEGMLMESMNLAVVWNLPVIFVCKDDKWSITTRSREFTAGTLTARAESFDMPAYAINGVNIQEAWTAASRAMTRARSGVGPSFIHAACQHQEGHFLGDPFLRSVRKPFRELPGITYPLLKSVLHIKGAGIFRRLESFSSILAHLAETIRSRSDPEKDPVRKARSLLENEPARLASLEEQVFREMTDLLNRVAGD